MGTRIKTFPFVEPSEEEWADVERFERLDARARVIIEAYAPDGGVEIEQLLQQTDMIDDCFAMAYGTSHDTWKAWKDHGFSHRSDLGDELLQRQLVWMGVAMRHAFIAGVAFSQAHNDLEQLLGDVDDLG